MVYFCVECAIRERLHELSGSQALVLLCIASHMNDKRQAWPSYAAICEETGLSRTPVSEALKRLVSSGWLKVIRGQGGRSNRYCLASKYVHMNGNGGTTSVQNLDSPSPESRLSSVQKVDSDSPESRLEVDTIEVDTTEVDTKKKNTRSRELVFSADFAAFWAVYPRKDGKQSAWRRWQTRRHEKVTAATMTAAAANYAAYCEAVGTEQRFIKHAATFIGPDRHYEEWLEPRTAPKNGGRGREAEFDEAARLLGIKVAE